MKRVLLVFAGLAFSVFAALNLNDPDPVIWVIAYGAVAVLFMLAAFGRADRRIIGWYVVALTIWMCTMLPGMWQWARMGFPTITGTMLAHEPHIEVVREFLGLLIAVIALFVLFKHTPSAARFDRKA
jgi:hypothetical protein